MSKINKINIAKTICYLVSQKINDERNNFSRRLYSVTKAQVIGKKKQITYIENKFPIESITYSDKLNCIEIYQNDGDQNMQQVASYNINSGEITLTLTSKDKKLFYQSQYIVKDPYTDNACIILNPYNNTDDRTFIRQVKKSKAILSKLDNNKVNIYFFLNNNSKSFTKVNIDSKLNELQIKLNSVKDEKNILHLQETSKSTDDQLLLKQIQYVEEILKDEESLDKYNNQLKKWYHNYKSWSNNKNINTIENHLYSLEFEKYGDERLTQYQINLFDRTSKYDNKIIYSESTEYVYNYPKMESIQQDIIHEKEELSEKIKQLENKKSQRKNDKNKSSLNKIDTEITKLNNQFKAIDKTPIEQKLKEKRTIYKMEGEYGVIPPYLVSDILRYVKVGFVKDASDNLNLSSDNIEDFIKYIHGFKSIVFNIISLYNQLVQINESEQKNCRTRIKNKFAIETYFSSSLYQEYLWFDQILEDGNKSTYKIDSDISQLILFTPCEEESKVYNIIDPNGQKTQSGQTNYNFKLLKVDEPLYGNEIRIVNDRQIEILDFDLHYAEQYGTIKHDKSLSDNFNDFLHFKHNHTSEQIDDSNIIIDNKNKLLEEITKINEDIDAAFPPLPTPTPIPTSTPTTKPKLIPKPIISELDKILGSINTNTNNQKTNINTKDQHSVDNSNELITDILQSEELYLNLGDSQIQILPIKKINKKGKVILKDCNHFYKMNDKVTFIKLQGNNIENLFKKKSWLINIDPDNMNFFYLQIDENFEKDPEITSGFVHLEIPELFDTGKEIIDFQKNPKDLPTESRLQYKKRRTESSELSRIQDLGFTSLQDYLNEKENQENIYLLSQINTNTNTNIKKKNKHTDTDTDTDTEININIIKKLRKNKEIFNLLTKSELITLFFYYKENYIELNEANFSLFKLQKDHTLQLLIKTIEKRKKQEKDPKKDPNSIVKIMIDGVKIWENKIKIEIENEIARIKKEEKENFIKGTSRDEIYKKYLKYKLKYLKLKAILK